MRQALNKHMIGSIAKYFRNESKPKIIIWHPTKYDFGLGDRLRGFAGGIAYAEIVGAKLIVSAPPSQACPVEFNELFEKVENFSIAPKPIDIDIYTKNDEYEIIAEWDQKVNMTPMRHYEYLQNKHPFRVSPKKFKKKWKSVLKKLRPNSDIRSELEHLKSKMHSKALGVHLRRTDVMTCDSKLITSKNVDRFDETLWDKITELLSSKSYRQVFLASDDKDYFENWKQHLLNQGVEVLHYNQNWSASEFRQTSLDGVVIDMYMMASCDQVVGSIPSSLFIIGRGLGGTYRIIKPPEMIRNSHKRKPRRTFLGIPV